MYGDGLVFLTIAPNAVFMSIPVFSKVFTAFQTFTIVIDVQCHENRGVRQLRGTTVFTERSKSSSLSSP